MTTTRGDKLRDVADRMQKVIDAKLDPAVGHQNLTARRAAMAASMRKDGQHLEGIQRVLRRLAEWIDSPVHLPAYLRKITTKPTVERLVSWGRSGSMPAEDGWNAPEREKLLKAGIYSDEVLKSAWEAVREAYEDRRPPTAEEKRRELERGLIGVKIPGFFPTPDGLADFLVELAEITGDHLVLEPSAGKGDLAAAIMRDEPDCRVICVEVSMALSEILKARFEEEPHVNTVCGDFLEIGGVMCRHQEELMPAARGGFDRIVMNPPFEKGAEMDHVRTAYDQLAPGGRLISIMSAGPWFRDDRQSAEFRDWFKSLGGQADDLPAGSFSGAETFVQTGTLTRYIVMEKPPGL